MLPPNYPGPILTDESNAFASHTMRVRVPAIMQQVLDVNPDLPIPQRDAVAALRDEIASGAEMQPLREGQFDEYHAWRTAYLRRAGQTWHSTDWFFAETYAYRRLVDAVAYFETAEDPFLPIKQHEYASDQHRSLLDAALHIDAERDLLLHSLLGMDLWGNRVDLSYAESRTHDIATADDLLVDDRDAIARRLRDVTGDVQLIVDNAGSELTLDLVLADALLRDGWANTVTIHAKFHPTFVSDATPNDIQQFLTDCLLGAYGGAAKSLGRRLQTAMSEKRLLVGADPYWNSPYLWWEMPQHIHETLSASSLVFVKGDANYRRVVGDAYWPSETPFADVVSGVGLPIACIRTLKSDPIVGLPQGMAEHLQSIDERWRWSGKRGLIQAWVG